MSKRRNFSGEFKARVVLELISGQKSLTEKFAQSSDHARQRLKQVMLVFKPDIVLHRHCHLVRHKWIFRRRASPGRPKLLPEVDAWIVRLVKANL